MRRTVVLAEMASDFGMGLGARSAVGVYGGGSVVGIERGFSSGMSIIV
jgi:hypothetical protein